MALPFFSIMGPQMPMLADGGIYDPESGLSYIGPEARMPRGGDPDKTLVPDYISEESAAKSNELLKGTGLTVSPTQPIIDKTAIGTSNPVKINTYVSGRKESVYQATDGKEFTNKSDYIIYQNKLNNPTNLNPNSTNIIPPTTNIIPPTTITNPVVTTTGMTATNKRNAKEFLIAALRPYFASASDAGFLKDLEGIIDDYIKQDYDADTISVLLPQTKPYQERFKGNVARAAAGLSQLSPAEYIQAEEQYNEVLKRFNLGSLSNRDTFASLISGQVSAAELTDRVVNVYDRIRNADPALKSELDRVKELSAGQLSEADFAKALLTGETGANELKRKITTAEISAEARTRGLETTRAQQLEQLGVTREQARAGFEQIGLTQPRLTQLAEIYTKTTPDASGLQEELEREQFQGMQSERRRRLAEQEQTAFMGQSGVSGISLGRRRTGSI